MCLVACAETLQQTKTSHLTFVRHRAVRLGLGPAAHRPWIRLSALFFTDQVDSTHMLASVVVYLSSTLFIICGIASVLRVVLRLSCSFCHPCHLPPYFCCCALILWVIVCDTKNPNFGNIAAVTCGTLNSLQQLNTYNTVVLKRLSISECSCNTFIFLNRSKERQENFLPLLEMQ